jgi:hypothetical protein
MESSTDGVEITPPATSQNKDEAELDPAVVLDAINLTSQMIALSVSWITCPIHEHCDGSCSGNGRIVFEPVRVGTTRYSAQLQDHETSNLPLQQEEPISIPSEIFDYSPIDSEAGEIRLLFVQQAVFQSDPVVIELISAKFDDPKFPKYAALSYHWGPPVFDHTIVCNGKALRINASLHNALKRHRQDRFERPQLLWADAICINQGDKDELNLQIFLMRKIYEGAECVFVDLGDAPLAWYAGYDLMHRIKLANHLLKDKLPELLTMEHFSVSHGLIPPADHPSWRAYYRMLSSTWFRRTWTVQEVTLAKNIRCRYGRFNFDWDLLGLTFDFSRGLYLQLVRQRSVQEIMGEGILYRIRRIRYDYRSGRLKPWDLLWRVRDCEVSNPKDRVVALLGLLPRFYSRFRLDYTWPTEKLFHRFAVHILSSGMATKEQGGMLSFAGLHLRALEAPMPSWAPDWTAQSSKGPRVFANIREKPYAAAGESMPFLQSFGTGEERNILATLTKKLGSVTHLSSACGVNYIGQEGTIKGHSTSWLSWREEASQIVFQLAAEKGKLRYGDIKEAFCRTLVVDDLYTGDNATARSIPILDVCKAHDEAIAALSAGVDPFSRETAADTFRQQSLTASQCRRFGILDNGYMGLLPSCTAVGDEVHILSGITIPFVVRCGVGGKSLLVGDAYIHGVMDGEAVEDCKSAKDWTPLLLF